MLSSSRVRRPSPALVLAVIALLIALGGATYAAIPGSDGVIRGCYKNGGNLRVVESASDCKQSETAISWSQEGPAGPPGPPGPPGSGAAVSGHELVAVNRIIPPYSGTGQAVEATLQPTCPPGKKVTGGGYGRSINQSVPQDVYVSHSYPPTVRAWVVRAVSFSRDPVGVEATAICANAD